MKKTVITSLSLLAAVSVFGQGTINFTTKTTSATLGSVTAPIYGVNPADMSTIKQGNASTNGGSVDYTGHPLLAGTSFSASLFGGPNDGAIVLGTGLATTTFRTQATLAGFVNPPVGPAPGIVGVDAGGAARLQIRAWDNKGGTVTTWADALLRQDVAKGISATFTSLPLGGGTLQPPNLQGLTSFNLTVVPEPGVIALGVLGLGALLLRRRK